MKRIYTLLLLLFVAISGNAQHKSNPRLYYRQFNNEYIKIQTRIMNYYEASLRDQQREKVIKYYEVVNEQLAASRREIERTAPFKENENLKIGYLIGIDSLTAVFNRNFAEAHERGRYRLESHEQLKSYHQALDSAEAKVKYAFEILEEVEESFARENNMGIKREEEMVKRMKLITDVCAHVRPLTLSFYRLDHSMNAFIDTVVTHTSMNLDTFLLPDMLIELSDDLEQSKDETADLEIGDLKKDLQKQFKSYLSQIKSDLKKIVGPIAYTLHEQEFYTNECRDARIDLDFYAEDYASYARSFLKARQDYILEYFPQ